MMHGKAVSKSRIGALLLDPTKRVYSSPYEPPAARGLHEKWRSAKVLGKCLGLALFLFNFFKVYDFTSRNYFTKSSSAAGCSQQQQTSGASCS